MIDRRTMLGCAPALVGLAARAQALGPAVETTSGKVQGAETGRVHAFKGIPYAASTEGASNPGGQARRALDALPVFEYSMLVNYPRA